MTARQQNVMRFLNGAVRQKPVRWGFGAVLLSNTLLLFVLLLTEQLRWIHVPWSPPVTRVLFQIFLGTSQINTALFGTVSVGSAIFLYRRRKEDARADPMTLVRRMFITPLLYILSILWGWSWLAGHTPRVFGAAIIAVFVVSQIIHLVYYSIRGFRNTRAADAVKGTPAQTAGRGRRIAVAALIMFRARTQTVRYAFLRRWWEITHPGYAKRLSPPDRALFESVARGVTQNVEVLLKRGANPNLRLRYDMPLIAFCSSMGRTEAVGLLLDAGAEVDAPSPTTRMTALHSAAEKGNLLLAKLLVERGSDIEARMRSGATPLNLSALRGHTEVVRLLLASGASVDAAIRDGQTPLMSAAGRGHFEAVKVLLESGADRSLRNLNGRTALEQAKRKGHQDVIAVLEAE